MVGKKINGKTYYYLVESGRVGGRPRIVSQRYLGSADVIAAAVLEDGPGNHGQTFSLSRTPRKTRQLPFGDIAATWATILEVDLAGHVDSVIGHRARRPRPSRLSGGEPQADTPSPGVLIALAVLRQAVSPSPCLDLANWWSGTRPDRFVRPRIPDSVVDDRVFWRTMSALTPQRIVDVYATLTPGILDALGTPTPLLAFDLADFAIYAESMPRGLGLLATLEGAVPLLAIPYTPAELSSADLIDRLRSSVGRPVTQVFDTTGSPRADHFIGALRPGEYPDLVRTRIGRREIWPGVTVRDMRARVGGRDRRVIVLHSELAHAAQSRSLERDVSQTARRMAEIDAENPARALSDISAAAGLKAEMARLTARSRLDRELLGRQLLVTSHDDVDAWPVDRVVTAYRARYRLESSLRVPFVPRPASNLRWTDRRIAVDALVRTLATAVTHLMRQRAHAAGLDLSAPDLIQRLGQIRETQVTFAAAKMSDRGTGGRPRTVRLLTELDASHRLLFDLFALSRWAPHFVSGRSGSSRPRGPGSR